MSRLPERLVWILGMGVGFFAGLTTVLWILPKVGVDEREVDSLTLVAAGAVVGSLLLSAAVALWRSARGGSRTEPLWWGAFAAVASAVTGLLPFLGYEAETRNQTYGAFWIGALAAAVLVGGAWLVKRRR